MLPRTVFSSQKGSLFLAVFRSGFVFVALQPKLLQDLIFVFFSLQFAALGLAEYNTVSQTVKDRACSSVPLSCPASGRKLFEVSWIHNLCLLSSSAYVRIWYKEINSEQWNLMVSFHKAAGACCSSVVCVDIRWHVWLHLAVINFSFDKLFFGGVLPLACIYHPAVTHLVWIS